jgi:hypothetical protein
VSQVKALVLFIPRTIQYWSYMIKDRIKYGKPKGDQCGRFGCWAFVWVDSETGEEMPEHSSFRSARALAPRLECFIYHAKCGCVKRWWGTHFSYSVSCKEFLED